MISRKCLSKRATASSTDHAAGAPDRIGGNRSQSPRAAPFMPTRGNGLLFAAGVLLLISVAVPLLSGCKTTRRESDLPWNERQNWEGGPALPAGFGSY